MSFISSALSNSISKFLGEGAGDITLSCNGNSFKFPINPPEIGVSVTNKNSTVNIINLGEYNMIGKQD